MRGIIYFVYQLCGNASFELDSFQRFASLCPRAKIIAVIETRTMVNHASILSFLDYSIFFLYGAALEYHPETSASAKYGRLHAKGNRKIYIVL